MFSIFVSISWFFYLLSFGFGFCFSMFVEEGIVLFFELFLVLEFWGRGFGFVGVKVLLFVGGSGGWKAGDMCFLFRVLFRRWVWKFISFILKLYREKK